MSSGLGTSKLVFSEEPPPSPTASPVKYVDSDSDEEEESWWSLNTAYSAVLGAKNVATNGLGIVSVVADSVALSVANSLTSGKESGKEALVGTGLTKDMNSDENLTRVEIEPLLQSAGELFVFSSEEGWRLTAFRFVADRAEVPPSAAVIYIGGMNDGFLSSDYLPSLSRNLPAGWCVIQPLLSSCYTGYGSSSIDNDCTELNTLLKVLKESYRISAFILMGFSTGAQDAVRLLQVHPNPMIKGIILQSGISDRQAYHMDRSLGDVEDKLMRATKLVSNNQGDITLPKSYWPYAPMTARRFVDLISFDGADDFFSSDFSDEEMKNKLGHIKVPTLICLGDQDEYIPKFVNKTNLMARWSKVIPGKVTTSLLQQEGHYFSDSKAFLRKATDFINGRAKKETKKKKKKT